MRSGASTGKTFEKEISKSLDAFGFHYVKIATCSSVGIGVVASRFMKSPPYDHFAVLDKTYGLEEKCFSGDKVTSLPFNRLETHQETGLLSLESKGVNTRGIILINIRKPTSKCFAIRISNWIKLRKDLHPRKSLPVARLQSNPFIQLLRVKRTWITELGVSKSELVWDLDPIRTI